MNGPADAILSGQGPPRFTDADLAALLTYGGQSREDVHLVAVLAAELLEARRALAASALTAIAREAKIDELRNIIHAGSQPARPDPERAPKSRRGVRPPSTPRER